MYIYTYKLSIENRDETAWSGQKSNSIVNSLHNILGFEVKLTCPALVWFTLIFDSKSYAFQLFAEMISRNEFVC